MICMRMDSCLQFQIIKVPTLWILLIRWSIVSFVTGRVERVKHALLHVKLCGQRQADVAVIKKVGGAGCSPPNPVGFVQIALWICRTHQFKVSESSEL